MTTTPPEPHHTSDNHTLNMTRSSPRSPAEPIHSTWTTNSPPANTFAPRQIFNPDGTRKYLNIRPAGAQPFPLKKGKKYLAEDYKDGVKVKKGSRSPAQEKERIIKQEDLATSREPSSVDSDSSPERPLIEVSRSARMDGEWIDGSATGVAEVSEDTGNKSEDDRGRQMGRDVGKRNGAGRRTKRHEP